MTQTPSLVLGASSLVGRHLLPRLAAAAPVIALSRHPPAGGAGRVRWVAGDLRRPDQIDEALRAEPLRAEVVFSCSPIWLLDDAVLETLRRRGMRTLVAFSSTSVVTKAASPVASEQAVVQALAAGEAAVARIGGTGVAWTVLRPTLIYDEGRDGNVSRIAGLVRRFGVFPMAGAGQGLRQPVHADDLAELAVRAGAAPADRVFDAPGPETLPYRTMVQRVFEGVGRPPRIVAVPEPLLRAAMAVAQPLLPGVNPQMLARMNADLVFDIDPVAQAYDWSPRPFEPRF